MSAWDKLFSFARSRANDDELIRDGLTYGDARALEVKMEGMAQAASDLAAKVIVSGSQALMVHEINAVGELLRGLKTTAVLAFPHRFAAKVTAILAAAGNHGSIQVAPAPVCDHVGPFTAGAAATTADKERMQLYNAGYEAGLRHGTNPRPVQPENDTQHAERLRNAPGLYEAIRWVDHYMVMPLRDGCPELLREIRARLVFEKDHGRLTSDLMGQPTKEQS